VSQEVDNLVNKSRKVLALNLGLMGLISPHIVRRSKSCQLTAFGKKIAVQFYQHSASNFTHMRRGQICLMCRSPNLFVICQTPIANKSHSTCSSEKVGQNVGEIEPWSLIRNRQISRIDFSIVKCTIFDRISKHKLLLELQLCQALTNNNNNNNNFITHSVFICYKNFSFNILNAFNWVR